MWRNARKVVGIGVLLIFLAIGAIWAGLALRGGTDTTADSTSSGQVAIGGPFTLTNTAGETVTPADFEGRYKFIYFGYTYCPDVCPTALIDMSRALNQLAETAPDKAKAITPIFITVDPERDDVAAMKAYINNFHDRMVGLTGTPDQTAQAAKSYRVYYEKVKEDRPEGEYLMNHSSYVFLMGPKGDYIDHFTHKTGPDNMATKLADLVAG